MKIAILAAALVLTSAACTKQGRAPAIQEAPGEHGDVDPAGVLPARPDFRNMVYRPDCTGGEPLRVAGGRYQVQSEDEDTLFEVRKVVFGDLDGDGRDDAAVFTMCDTGGSGRFSEVVPFLLKGARAVALTAVAGGDRADGGIADIWIEAGGLVVEQYSTGEGHGACCPALIETQRYVWTGAAFVPEGARSRRPYTK